MNSDPYSLNLPEDHAFYAAVVSDGKALSSVWRFWSDGDEVYVGVPTIRGEFKTSLHKSGQFRHAFTNKKVAKRFLGKNANRAFDQWNRPNPTPEGVTWLLQIAIPGVGIGASLHQYFLPNGTYHLAPPRPDELLVLSLLCMPPVYLERNIKLEGRPLHVIDHWTLSNGNLMAIVWSTQPLPEGLREFLRGLSHKIAEEKRGVNDSEPGEARLILPVTLSTGNAKAMLDAHLDALDKWISAQV